MATLGDVNWPCHPFGARPIFHWRSIHLDPGYTRCRLTGGSSLPRRSLIPIYRVSRLMGARVLRGSRFGGLKIARPINEESMKAGGLIAHSLDAGAVHQRMTVTDAAGDGRPVRKRSPSPGDGDAVTPEERPIRSIK